MRDNLAHAKIKAFAKTQKQRQNRRKIEAADAFDLLLSRFGFDQMC